MISRPLRAAAVALAGLAALAAPLPAAAQAKAIPQRATTVFVVRDAAAPDPAPRDVDYGQLLTVQTADSLPGVRLLETLRAPLGNTLVAAGTVLVAVRQPNGRPAWCHSIGGYGLVLPQGARYCFEDADADGRFDQAFYGNMEPVFSRILHGFVMTPMKRVTYRYETLAEPGTPAETLALRYVGPTEGLIRDGRIVHGRIAFEIVLGPDRVHLSKVAGVSVPLDAAGRGRARGPLGFDIQVEQATPDGRARVQVLAAPGVGEKTV